jgi:hypothetical protein
LSSRSRKELHHIKTYKTKELRNSKSNLLVLWRFRRRNGKPSKIIKCGDFVPSFRCFFPMQPKLAMTPHSVPACRFPHIPHVKRSISTNGGRAFNMVRSAHHSFSCRTLEEGKGKWEKKSSIKYNQPRLGKMPPRFGALRSTEWLHMHQDRELWRRHENEKSLRDLDVDHRASHSRTPANGGKREEFKSRLKGATTKSTLGEPQLDLVPVLFC